MGGGPRRLHNACMDDQTQDVQNLLDFGADRYLETTINDPSYEHDGMTPLHIACKRGHAEIVKLLLSISADVNAKTKNGKGLTPMHLVCMSNHTFGDPKIGE